MEKSTFYETLFLGLYQSVDQMVEGYKHKDNNRNHVNYGAAIAYQRVMHEMGHEVELRVYGEDGYLVTNKITIDGRDFEFFH